MRIEIREIAGYRGADLEALRREQYSQLNGLRSDAWLASVTEDLEIGD
jgi:hypothetical protein